MNPCTHVLRVHFLFINYYCKYLAIQRFKTFLFTPQMQGDILINELRVTIELRLLHELRVTSYFYCTPYKLLFAC